MIEDNSSEGGGDYEVYLDDIRIIKRTKNLEKLENVPGRISDENEILKIVIFHGESNNNEKYQLTLNEDETLAGVDLEQAVIKEVGKARQGWEHEQLQEKVIELKEQLEGEKAYANKLRAENVDLKSKSNPLGNPKIVGILSGIAGAVLSGDASRIASSITGAGEETEPEPETGEESYKIIEDDNEVELSREELALLEAFEKLQKMGTLPATQVYSLFQILSDNENMIAPIMQAINTEIQKSNQS